MIIIINVEAMMYLLLHSLHDCTFKVEISIYNVDHNILDPYKVLIPF